MKNETKVLVEETKELSNMNLNERGGGLRFNGGKLRYDLVHPRAHKDMVKVLTMGANKYNSRNWEIGMNWTTIVASMKRHIAAIECGKDYDQESGLLHAAHIQCNAHFLNAYYHIYPQGDDRPKNFLNVPRIGLDVDEVICNFVDSWKMKFKINDVPTSWFFDRHIIERFEELKEKKELDDFYLSLKPLTNPEDIPFEPHCYITSRPVDCSITEQWLDTNGYPTRPVYSVGTNGSKVEVAKKSGVEIFIDDSYDNFVQLNNVGIFCYLFDKPHNHRYNVGHMRIKKLNDLPWFRE